MSDIESLPSTDSENPLAHRRPWARLSPARRVGVTLSSAVLLAVFLLALNEFFSIRGVVDLLISRVFLGVWVVSGTLLALLVGRFLS
jgi:hypothetical protein